MVVKDILRKMRIMENENEILKSLAVSYTHLTLPTKA